MRVIELRRWHGPLGEITATVDAGQLRDLLTRHASRVRLVVLSTCDGANPGSPGNELGSVAQAIHRAGVETVVASRHPLSLECSTVLARTLYRELLGGPAAIEAAFLAARERLARDPERLDWASIQLYSGAAGGEGREGGDSRPVVVRPADAPRPGQREGVDACWVVSASARCGIVS